MDLQDLIIDVQVFNLSNQLIYRSELICPFDLKIIQIKNSIIDNLNLDNNEIQIYYQKTPLDDNKKIYYYFQDFQDEYLLNEKIVLQIHIDLSGEIFQSHYSVDKSDFHQTQSLRENLKHLEQSQQNSYFPTDSKTLMYSNEQSKMIDSKIRDSQQEFQNQIESEKVLTFNKIAPTKKQFAISTLIKKALSEDLTQDENFQVDFLCWPLLITHLQKNDHKFSFKQKNLLYLYQSLNKNQAQQILSVYKTNQNYTPLQNQVILSNLSSFQIQQQNYIDALENLKEESKIILQLDFKETIKSLLLSQCYLKISLCLFKNSKIEEAMSLLQKSMKLLFESNDYSESDLNQQISLMLQISEKQNSIHSTLAKYIKQCEKISQSDNRIEMRDQRFLLNLFSYMGKLNSMDNFQPLFMRLLNQVEKEFKQILGLKYFFKKQFVQIAENLLQLYLLQEYQKNDKEKEIEFLLKETETIHSPYLQSMKVDWYIMKTSSLIKKDYRDGMKFLSKAIEISKQFSSAHPVHQKLLHNLNVFNNLSN